MKCFSIINLSRHWLLSGWYPPGLIVHQQRYSHSDSNKNVDIKHIVSSNHFNLKVILHTLSWVWILKLKCTSHDLSIYFDISFFFFSKMYICVWHFLLVHSKMYIYIYIQKNYKKTVLLLKTTIYLIWQIIIIRVYNNLKKYNKLSVQLCLITRNILLETLCLSKKGIIVHQ